MWKQDIVEYLNNKSIAQQNEIYKTLSNLVSNAEVFFFGEAESFDNTIKKNKDAYKRLLVDVPYDITLVEWKEKRLGGSEDKFVLAPKRTVLIHSQPNVGTQTFYNIYYSTMPYADSVDMFMAGVKTAKEIMESGIKTWCVSPVACLCDKEKKTFFDWSEDGFWDSASDIILKHVQQETDIDFMFSRIFIDILNCNNIVTKDVTPPEKVNKKRTKSGKLPLYSYKILEVMQGKQKTKNAGSVGWDYQSPKDIRFSFTRGHYKTYTEERPLLGKQHGRWWWNPHARGNKDVGVIEKEYHVKKDKE